MTRAPIMLAMMLASLSCFADATSEVFCFSSFGRGGGDFELRTYTDASAGWGGAFVKYKASKTPISLVLTSIDSEMIDENMPYRSNTKWLEVNDEKVTGEYEMVSQGAGIDSMSYTNYRTKKRYDFLFNENAIRSDNGCTW